MNKLAIILTICFGVILLGGCPEAANENANKPAENTNTEANKEEPKEAAKLNPDEIKLDSPVSINDLVTSAAADMDSWKDKEVAVKGVVYASSGSGGEFGYVVSVKNDKEANTSENLLTCKVPKGDVPKDILSKEVTMKGKIKDIKDKGIMVRLEPCELKMEGGESAENKDDKADDSKDEKPVDDKKEEKPADGDK